MYAQQSSQYPHPSAHDIFSKSGSLYIPSNTNNINMIQGSDSNHSFMPDLIAYSSNNTTPVHSPKANQRKRNDNNRANDETMFNQHPSFVQSANHVNNNVYSSTSFSLPASQHPMSKYNNFQSEPLSLPLSSSMNLMMPTMNKIEDSIPILQNQTQFNCDGAVQGVNNPSLIMTGKLLSFCFDDKEITNEQNELSLDFELNFDAFCIPDDSNSDCGTDPTPLNSDNEDENSNNNKFNNSLVKKENNQALNTNSQPAIVTADVDETGSVMTDDDLDIKGSSFLVPHDPFHTSLSFNHNSFTGLSQQNIYNQYNQYTSISSSAAQPSVQILSTKYPQIPKVVATTPAVNHAMLNSNRRTSTRNLLKKKRRTYNDDDEDEDFLDGNDDVYTYTDDESPKRSSASSKVTVRGSDKEKQKKRYKCNQCPRTFSSKPNLETHLLTHLGEEVRSHKCEICGAGFFTSGCLKSHMNTHTDHTLFPCTSPGCTKVYQTAEGLRLHIRNHHEIDKRWLCLHDKCGRKFVRQSDLRMHIIRMHSDVRPFPCGDQGCDKAFACHSELRRHIATTHKENREELLRLAQSHIKEGSQAISNLIHTLNCMEKVSGKE